MTAVMYIGDAIEVMSKLPEKSVDLILTSPPFLALRSYLPADHPDKALEGGSQATPGLFIDWLIDVVEACDRVLAPHGSMCVELGDTYAGSGGAGGDYNADGLRNGQPTFTGSGKLANYNDARGNPDGMRDTTFSGGNTRTGGGSGWPLAKSLSLIPELFRFTLVYGFNPLTGRQTERWRLRNVVRWVRPNPPVGALGDKFRPATSELMVFCKSAKRYFDLDAVREPYKFPNHPQIGKPHMGQKNADKDGNWGTFPNRQENPAGAPPLDWWNIPPGGYEGAHYAVFPPELCVKPIKAMCPEKVCRVCGEPSRRIVETDYAGATWPSGGTTNGLARQPERVDLAYSGTTQGWTDCGHHCKQCGGTGKFTEYRLEYGLPGYQNVEQEVVCPVCDGESNWRPGLVLDPFGGSGTTALVATGHGRDAILIDLDERNFDLALERVGPFILNRQEPA